MMFTRSRRWELVGIKSYGDGCVKPTHAGVYTRLTAFHTFILTISNTTLSKCSCQCPRGSPQGVAYTTSNSAEACIDACKAVSLNPCVSSNTYACLGISCGYSIAYSFDNNKVNERAYLWPNGDRYAGQVKGDKRHGTGTHHFANGNKYSGDWIDDAMAGHGIYTWKNGDRYEGQFKDNKRHGTGTYNYANGSKYTGDWTDNDMTGHGIYTLKYGDRYEGQFKGGKKHGTGTYHSTSGNRYTGDWIDDDMTRRRYFDFAEWWSI